MRSVPQNDIPIVHLTNEFDALANRNLRDSIRAIGQSIELEQLPRYIYIHVISASQPRPSETEMAPIRKYIQTTFGVKTFGPNVDGQIYFKIPANEWPTQEMVFEKLAKGQGKAGVGIKEFSIAYNRTPTRKSCLMEDLESKPPALKKLTLPPIPENRFFENLEFKRLVKKRPASSSESGEEAEDYSELAKRRQIDP